ncbi:MAG TPA: T9SS type A sorting domain-containing protein [Chitinophagales bacterium]|nr:T9SS type A sorting domain-containing protein [Chitinophagales bacterium]
MKTITIIVMILSLSVMYHFAEAQNPCQGNKVRMSKGVYGCGCHCQSKCVAPSQVQTYLDNGYHYGECIGNCCWVRTGEDLPASENSLRDIYPNPVSGSATVFFSLSQTQEVSFKLFDMTGRLVMTLEEEVFEDGENEFVLNTSDINAGFYFLKMETGSYSETKKVSVIK